MPRFSWVLIGFLILALTRCSGDPAFVKDGIRVTEVSLEERLGGARILRGFVENGTEEELSIVQIQFSLYDGDNRRVDSMGIVVRSIPPGGRSAFREAVQSDHDVRGVKPRSVLIP